MGKMIIIVIILPFRNFKVLLSEPIKLFLSASAVKFHLPVTILLNLYFQKLDSNTDLPASMACSDLSDDLPVRVPGSGTEV